MPSCSAIDLAEILRSSKIISWIWSIISGVVAVLGRSGRGASQLEKSPRLNWTTQFLTVAYDGACSPNVSIRIAWIPFSSFPCRKKKKTCWQLASPCWNRAHRLTCFLSASVTRKDLQFGTWTDPSCQRHYRFRLQHGEVVRAKDLSAPLVQFSKKMVIDLSCRLYDRERWQTEMIETLFWTVCWVSYEGTNFETYGNTLVISLCRWEYGLWSRDENCGCELEVQTRNCCSLDLIEIHSAQRWGVARRADFPKLTACLLFFGIIVSQNVTRCGGFWGHCFIISSDVYTRHFCS